MMSNIRLIPLTLVLLGSTMTFAQEIQAVVLDSLTQQPIPYASIYLKSGSGVLSNEDGFFKINLPSDPKDSLFVSCIGFKTQSLAPLKKNDSIIFLTPEAIELNNVILSNKQLKVSEIIHEIQKNIPEKYEMGVTTKRIFFRETGSQSFKKLKVAIKKTSIPEFGQSFWNQTLAEIPNTNSWYFEILGDLTGDYMDENQKLKLERALELEDKNKTAFFENIDKLFDTIIKKNVKTDSYFKIRTGIIGGKIDSDEINSTAEDTLTAEEKTQNQKDFFLKRNKTLLGNLMNTLFDKDRLNARILKKASQYEFSLKDYTFLGDTPMYIISFRPKRKADFKGTLYVDADLLTLVRIDYQNTKAVRDISLMGISFKEDHRSATVQFKKHPSGKYCLEYLDYESSFEAGFDRPLVITEKNKVVKGRNKQNQLKMDVNVVNRNTQRYQLVVFESNPITQQTFDALEEKADILPVNKTTYDPEFWKGFTIIEPNTAIKEFKPNN